MKLSSDAIRRRQQTHALVFAAGALALTGLAWLGPKREHACLLLLLAIPIGSLARGTAALRAGRRLIRRLGARLLSSATLVGALALAASVAATLEAGVPLPSVHDEFSYLLAADTFAQGRLTNPPHPFWVHFEAPHVLQQPTYMSKYLPAQGLVMAAGQVTLGHPIAGVWLSAALACGALTWMLAGWMPGRWALAGGLVGVVHPLRVVWTQGYWGGLVAVLGGALLLGALGRLVRRSPRGRHAVILGLGLGILANSRPYEGLVLSAPLLIALGVFLLSRHGPPGRIAVTRILVPLASVVLLVASGMLYYNYRVTGDPLTMPYMAYQRAYMPTGIFIFQRASPSPPYRHEHLRRLLDPQPPPAPERTLAGLAESVREHADAYAGEFLGSTLAAVLIATLLPLERNRWWLLLILTLLLVTVGLGLSTVRLPHYAAPAAGLTLLVAMRALRSVGRWHVGRARVGRSLAQATWVVGLGVLVLGWGHRVAGGRAEAWQDDRARMAAALNRTGEKHLVLVRYTPGHNDHAEWIYNAADIDAAPIVWAADMDAAGNARLLDYFKGRRVWLLEPDREGAWPVPYPVGSGSSLAPAP
jgi:hypothetical protein